MNGSSASVPGGQTAAHPNPRLLLAEDDPATRELLREMLRSEYEVVPCPDGEQAWAAAQHEPPDLVLSDVLMPGSLDGVSLVRRLRGDVRTASVPIILLTANTEQALRLQALEAGADDFLLKPFNSPELLTRLRTHRRLVELRREVTARQSDERYRLIVESARDYAIFTLDSERRVTSWNPGAEVMTGYPASDMVGQSADRLFTPEDRELGVPVKEIQKAHDTGHCYNERWHVREDGRHFWGSGVVMPLRDGTSPPGALKILRDLTAQHQAEAARRQAEDRFELVVRSIDDYAIYMLDPQGHITTWNPGAERIKGFTSDEILGQHYEVCFTSEDRAAGRPGMELAVASREGRFQEEHWRIRKGGERYWGEELIVALRGVDGELIGYTRVCRDLSERKSHEEERARLLAAEQAARQEAEAANRAKDHFLAVLSHELRTPLTPVQLALHVMERDQGLSSATRSALEMIGRNVQSEVRLIGDLLDVSRIVHGKLELRPEPMDLQKCLGRVLELCRGDFAAKQQTVTAVLKASVAWIAGDPDRWRQVFSNLLQNASKFTPERGEITVRSSDSPDGSEIILEVQDNGLGIEPAALQRIFDPFEQETEERARTHGGLGLGLAISHAIVAAHGGELTAESPGPGQGATFRIRLPR